MTKNKRTKSKGSNGFFQEFIDQLITAIFGELLIYIIALCTRQISQNPYPIRVLPS